MSLAFVQRAHFGNSASSSSQTATFGTPTTAGNLIVALGMNLGASNTFSSFSDDKSNTYVRGPAQFDGGPRGFYNIFYAKNATGGVTSVTQNLIVSNIYSGLAIYEISGADTTAPYDTTASATGTGTAISSGTLTLAASSEIIIAIIGNAAGGTMTAGSGYSLEQWGFSGDPNNYEADEYHIVSSSEAATATDAVSEGWAILAASFKAAAGGGKLFIPSDLNGLGSGGPFFHDRLAS